MLRWYWKGEAIAMTDVPFQKCFGKDSCAFCNKEPDDVVKGDMSGAKFLPQPCALRAAGL